MADQLIEVAFKPFQKIARLSRECIITEKIDGTNGVICITEDGQFLVGSRTQWITPGKDNFGFAKWAHENKEELLRLGIGTHYGEWWGYGIQRGYGLQEKRFSLFNTSRWNDDDLRPKCCHVVPTLWSGIFNTDAPGVCITQLSMAGSTAAPGFLKPEGIIIFHVGGNLMFKKTIEKDEEWKGKK